MIENEFSSNRIERTIFIAVRRTDARLETRIVPCDARVNQTLLAMLVDTHMILESGGGEIYEISEEPATNISYRLPLEDDLAEVVRSIYRLDESMDDNFADFELEASDYYCGVFVDRGGRKMVGVRRATSFKQFLRRKYQVQFTGGALEMSRDNVFALDDTFDFLIGHETIFIANKTAFENLAELTRIVAATAVGKLEFIEAILPFLDLSGIKPEIGKHPRVARWAVSIARRPDLSEFTLDQVRSEADKAMVRYVIDRGRLRPLATDRNALLKLLDNRRYAQAFIPNKPEVFESGSRKRITG